jgi:hypothetical protein
MKSRCFHPPDLAESRGCHPPPDIERDYMNRATTILWTLLLTLLPPVCAAQTVIVTGAIRGRVLDPSGAVVPSAQVELLEQATATCATTSSGSCILSSRTRSQLLPGECHQGFFTAVGFDGDLSVFCQRVNEKQPRLPDGRLLQFSVKEPARPILHGQK